MMTTYERGRLAGQLEMAIKMALRQLEAKFGPLPPEIKSRVEALSPQQLEQLGLDLIKAQSLEELGLQG
jgi:Domain of unknown function (DUF4351)